MFTVNKSWQEKDKLGISDDGKSILFVEYSSSNSCKSLHLLIDALESADLEDTKLVSVSKRRVQVFNWSVWQTGEGSAHADNTEASPSCGCIVPGSIEPSDAIDLALKCAWH